MSEEKPAFTIEGSIGALWNEAKDEFLRSDIASGHTPTTPVEQQSDPATWLDSFRKKRNKNADRVSATWHKVGRHLGTIQLFVQALGFSVAVASAVAPMLSPASLVVNAFGWLFDSFAKVSTDFDKIEIFFEVIASRLENLSVIKDHFTQHQEPEVLHRKIVELFISCLGICKVGSKQVEHRIKTWLGQWSGHSQLDPALDRFTRADDALRSCFDMRIFGTVLEIRAFMSKFDTILEDLRDTKNRDDRDEMLDWLSSRDSPRMHELIKQKTPDLVTGGKWLLESDLFNEWKANTTDRIWYTGKPGAGKTVLASIIIDHLKGWAKEASHESTVLVAYLYLSYTTKPDVTELLGSVLRQFQEDIDFHPGILDKFHTYRYKGKTGNRVENPTQEDLKEMLKVISKDKKIFVVVDALDEFEINSRKELLDSLKDIKPEVKILITSRVLNHLSKLQEGFETSTIEAHEEDMNEYIDHVIKRRPNLQCLPQFHQEIKGKVKRKSGNMFIIVRLHMAAISNASSSGDLEKVLEKLPDNINDAYKNTMDRIKTQEEATESQATSALGWIAFSQRLLSTRELQHALAIEKSEGDDVERFLRPENEIISDCCGILVIDLDGKVRYVHRSAQEFFNISKDEAFVNFDTKIALSCVRYLSMQDLWPLTTEGSSRSIPVDSMEDRFPLLRYAGEFLHKHHRRIRDIEKDENTLIHDFVLDDDTRTIYSRLLSKFHAYDRRSTFLDDANEKVNPRQTSDQTLHPLHIAVYLGNFGSVKKLVDDGADVNALDPYGQSAFSVAIKSGLDEIAGLLLRSGAEIDLATKKGHVILLHAMERNYTTVVGHIIGSSNNTVSNDRFLEILGYIVLIILVQFEALKALLFGAFFRIGQPSVNPSHTLSSDGNKTKNDIDPSLEKYRQLLNCAYDGDIDGLELLLERSASEPINLSPLFPGEGDVYTDLGESDSHRISRAGSAYYEFDDSDLSVGSNSSESADNYSGSSVLDSDEEQFERETDRDMDTASTCRHLEGNSEDKNRLMQDRNGVSPESSEIKTAFVRTACFLAAERGRHEVVSRFLKHGVSPDLTNFQGKSLLHRATARDDYKLAEILLKNHANPNQRDENGRTALMANASLKKMKILKLLIRQGADLDLRQREGSHEMYEAAVFGAASVVEFYLKLRVDASITNNFGWTPLHGAAANGHYECVRLLLQNGANPSPLSDTYDTPLDFINNGEQHYDSILTGGKHYAAQINEARELSTEDKRANKDEILHLLTGRNALTKWQMVEIKGQDAVRRMGSHRSWQRNSWWDKRERKPYYRHVE